MEYHHGKWEDSVARETLTDELSIERYAIAAIKDIKMNKDKDHTSFDFCYQTKCTYVSEIPK